MKHRFGINGVSLAFFESYLRDRTLSVSVGSFVSDVHEICCGVPQGSVLGPTMFSLYTAPLEDIMCSHGLDFMMYADDVQLYITCVGEQSCEQINCVLMKFVYGCASTGSP